MTRDEAIYSLEGLVDLSNVLTVINSDVTREALRIGIEALKLGSVPVVAGEASASPDRSAASSSESLTHAVETEPDLPHLRANVIGELEIADAADAAHAIGHLDALVEAVARSAFSAGWDATKWVMCGQSHEEAAASMAKQLQDAFWAYRDRTLPPFGSGNQASDAERAVSPGRSAAPSSSSSSQKGPDGI